MSHFVKGHIVCHNVVLIVIICFNKKILCGFVYWPFYSFSSHNSNFSNLGVLPSKIYFNLLDLEGLPLRSRSCVVVPLGLAKGLHYTEPVHEYNSDDDLDYIYKITAREKDWVNRPWMMMSPKNG